MDESKDAVDSGNAQQASSTASSTIINIEKLAEKVYQLMRAEVRLAQARGDRRSKKR